MDLEIADRKERAKNDEISPALEVLGHSYEDGDKVLVAYGEKWQKRIKLFVSEVRYGIELGIISMGEGGKFYFMRQVKPDDLPAVELSKQEVYALIDEWRKIPESEAAAALRRLIDILPRSFQMRIQAFIGKKGTYRTLQAALDSISSLRAKGRVGFIHEGGKLKVIVHTSTGPRFAGDFAMIPGWGDLARLFGKKDKAQVDPAKDEKEQDFSLMLSSTLEEVRRKHGQHLSDREIAIDYAPQYEFPRTFRPVKFLHAHKSKTRKERIFRFIGVFVFIWGIPIVLAGYLSWLILHGNYLIPGALLTVMLISF
ncbi:MAG: hypothetical protein JRI96_14825, partial [Deltaproteobacteria bacterium]|nr:hypothetical protein [Deltaproteobacteria bacterium]